MRERQENQAERERRRHAGMGHRLGVEPSTSHRRTVLPYTGCLPKPLPSSSDRISWHSQTAEHFQFGGLRFSSLLFADDVVLLAPSGEDLQLSLERFTAECEAAGMRISISKSKTMVLSWKKVACPLQGEIEVLPQMEEFKYLGVLCTRDERMELEINRRIGAASFVVQTLYRSVVVKTLYRSVVVKKELSQKARLSVYWLISVPTLTYGHKLGVGTERMRS